MTTLFLALKMALYLGNSFFRTLKSTKFSPFCGRNFLPLKIARFKALFLANALFIVLKEARFFLTFGSSEPYSDYTLNKYITRIPIVFNLDPLLLALSGALYAIVQCAIMVG